ncbi:urease accessory protein [Streptomyces sp. NBC_00669]|uniref:urease accessory protein UreF n=1 Tax=Streptomyces sp. NBC_00669 TaxID=2976011 RepID=UPI002E2F120E|nr:urease accessory UreF family protein [Streptomyces sp. NBC_00669]
MSESGPVPESGLSPESEPGIESAPEPGIGSLLVSLQLTDSAFPSGFYTLSHTLEGFAQAKEVDADSLPALLHGLLLHAVGPADATALALAHRATAAGDPETVVRIDEYLFATKLGREMRLASTRTGRQLLDLAREVFDHPEIGAHFERVRGGAAPGTQAVAAGIIYAAAGVPLRQAVVSDLFAFCASFAGAALRLRLTDHRKAQLLLRRAAPVIEAAAQAAMRRELADVGATAFASDVMSGRHERAEARLFAS